MKEIDEAIKKIFGALIDESDIDLMRIFFLNALTVRVHKRFQDVYGNDEPSFGKIISILNETTLNEHTKEKIANRVQYWHNQQNEKNWTDDLGFERSRRPPKSVQRQGICSWPGCENEGKMELDHMFPYSLGGSSREENFQTLCRSCNLAKGNSIYSINTWPTD